MNNILFAVGRYFRHQWQHADRIDRVFLVVAWTATPAFLVLAFTPLEGPSWVFLVVAALMLAAVIRSWVLFELLVRKWKREHEQRVVDYEKIHGPLPDELR